MYCKNCGQPLVENTAYCPYCGVSTSVENSVQIDDSPNIGFAIVGFLIPIVGVILYLICESKQPKRAKSAVKGAVVGFITKAVIAVVCTVVCITGMFSFIGNISDYVDGFVHSSIFVDESAEDILEKYADVAFGELKITDNGYYTETSLDVTITNKSDKRNTFFVTVEAIDENGVRLQTDVLCADRLDAGQSVLLTAFEFIDDDKIDKFRKASFKVLDINYLGD